MVSRLKIGTLLIAKDSMEVRSINEKYTIHNENEAFIITGYDDKSAYGNHYILLSQKLKTSSKWADDTIEENFRII